MADQGKGGLLTKSLKKLTRTKQKVLQNLGKAEKTLDERLDEHAHKLERQQDVAQRFNRELKGYLHCAKAMQAASKGLYQVLLETYESDWMEEDSIRAQLSSLELMWHNYIQNLQERVHDPLVTYMSHFPALKQRISKRGRKLTDYDNARHNLDVQQNAKKKDEVKTKKAQEELDECKEIYEQMNNELHNDLPKFYESRVNFYASTFERLFNSEEIFHGELTKLCSGINTIAEKLEKSTQALQFQPRPISTQVSAEAGHMNGHPENGLNGDSGHDSPQPSPGSSPTSPTPQTPPTPQSQQEHNETGTDAIYENSELETSVNEKEANTTQNSTPEKESKDLQADTKDTSTDSMTENQKSSIENKLNGDVEETASQDSHDSAPSYPPPTPPIEDAPPNTVESPSKEDIPAKEETPESPPSPIYDPVPPPSETVSENTQKNDLPAGETEEVHDDKNLYEVPTSNKPVELPPGVLYQVQATHPYNNEDDDELSFEAGEIIYVVPFDNPDEQDEGWVLGVKKSDGSKGVFPMNFTKKI